MPRKPHLCHAFGCSIEVPPSMLMHPEHWRMVSKPTRDWIGRTYVKGQEKTKTPSLEYLVAANTAIAEVARKEGRKLPEEVHRARAHEAQCYINSGKLRPGEPPIPGVTIP